MDAYIVIDTNVELAAFMTLIDAVILEQGDFGMNGVANRSTSLLPEYERLVASDPAFATGLHGPLNTGISLGDGMMSDDGAYYLACGRSALDCILLSVKQSQKTPGEIKDVLDFACGFGRVTRWLQAAFPEARTVAMDVDPRAVSAVKELFDVETHVIDRAWREIPEDRFDLIWVGSLFTHINESQSKRLLYLLLKLLKPGGILAVTTHGYYVGQRIESRSKNYGLPEDAILDLLQSYKTAGYGYKPYKSSLDYGIAIVTASKMIDLALATKLKPRLFIERGWIRHQDFFCFYR